MGVDDYMETETGIIAAATAAAVSPKARDLFRKGAVYGLAGVLRTGDMAVAAAKGAARGIKAEANGSGRSPSRAGQSRAGQSRRTAASRRTSQGSRSKQSSQRGRSSRG